MSRCLETLCTLARAWGRRAAEQDAVEHDAEERDLFSSQKDARWVRGARDAILAITS